VGLQRSTSWGGFGNRSGVRIGFTPS